MIGALRELLARIQDRTFRSHYLGVRAVKNPTDWWSYQEIIWETRPEVIVEIGVHQGGTTLALATICDAIGSGRVIGCDITLRPVHERVRAHPRITLIEGAAVDVQPRVRDLIGPTRRVLIIEDSSHDLQNTLAVLRAYSPLVGPGQYFIVEDGICGHGIDDGPRPGPYEAVQAFLAEAPEWESDRSREWEGLSWNPCGYLRRKAT